MKKSFKKVNGAISLVVIALVLFTTILCVVPCSASENDEYTLIKIEHVNGVYPALKNYIYEYGFDNVKDFKFVFLDPEYYPEYGNEFFESQGMIDVAVFEGGGFDLKTVLLDRFYYTELDYMINNPFTFTDYLGANMSDKVDVYLVIKGISSSSPESSSENSSSLIAEMFQSFRGATNGIIDGVKGMFNNIIWIDGTSESGLSGFAKFGFLIGGLSLALGLGYFIIRKIRG